MPMFIDHHPMPALPPEAMEQMKTMIQTHAADPNGVKTIGAYAGADGSAFCHTEAANAEAVIKSHAAMGVKLERGQITEVTSLA